VTAGRLGTAWVVAAGGGATVAELVGAARGLASSVVAFADAARPGPAGASAVYAVDAPPGSLPGPALAAAMEEVAAGPAGMPDVVLFPMTYDGRDAAGHLSARWDRPVLTNVHGLRLEGGCLVASASAAGGRVVVHTRFTGPPPWLVGVRPRAFPAATAGPAREPSGAAPDAGPEATAGPAPAPEPPGATAGPAPAPSGAAPEPGPAREPPGAAPGATARTTTEPHGAAPEATAWAAPRATAGLAPRATAGLAPRATAGLAPRATAGLAPRATAGLAPRATAGATTEPSGAAPEATAEPAPHPPRAVPVTADPGGARVVASHAEERAGPALDEAAVVVAGGRGLGSAEGFALVEELAGLLGGAAGATRAVVDSGWAPYACQVGQTGRTVAPQVYLAFGISGASQHLAGITGARHVVAVNTDPRAPILAVADLGIVGDAADVARRLIRSLRERPPRP
jgi:electron transfer flavoprotein alpha subunit